MPKSSHAAIRGVNLFRTIQNVGPFTMPRKKSLMPRVRGEKAAPQPKMTRLEKLYPLHDREIGTEVYQYNKVMRDFGYKWLEYPTFSNPPQRRRSKQVSMRPTWEFRRKIYSIFSQGIHELDNEKCLEFFEVGKRSIIIVLEDDLKHNQELLARKEMAEAVRKFSGDPDVPVVSGESAGSELPAK